MTLTRSIVSLFVLGIVMTAVGAQKLPLLIVPPEGPTLPTLATGGIPVPTNVGIVNTDMLAVTDSLGNIIPSAVRILARRPNRPDRAGSARWINVSMPWRPGDPTQYFIGWRPEEIPPPKNLGNGVTANSLRVGDFLLVRGDEKHVLDSITWRGRPIGSALSLELENEEGRTDPWIAETPRIELNTPTEVRVRARGRFGNGLEATVRWTVSPYSPLIRLSVRLENPRPCVHAGEEPRYFRRLALTLQLPKAATRGWDGVTASPHALPLAVDLFANEDYKNDFQEGLEWRIDDSKGVKTGLVHPGVVGIGDDEHTLIVARSFAAFEAPTRFWLTAQTLTVDLLPRSGSGPHHRGPYGDPFLGSGSVDAKSKAAYRFEGGRWKTFELALAPEDSGDPSLEVLKSVVQTLETPPLLQAPKEWNTVLNLTGVLVPQFRPDAPEEERRWQRMVRLLVDDDAADELPGIGRVGLPGLLRRGGTYGGYQPYGWYNFGDVTWTAGFCSLHYDLPRTLFASWLASGERRFFDQGQIMVAHQRDLDMVHTRPADRFTGGQMYEKGWYHGNFQPPVQSHHWVTGLMLHYVMTGHPGTRETLDQAGQYLLGLSLADWDGNFGARMVGWPLDNLITMWLLTAEEPYLDAAKSALSSFQRHEARYGRKGFVLNGASRNDQFKLPAVMKSWQHAILLSAGCRFTQETQDRRFLPLLARMGRHLMDHCYIPSETTGNSLHPARVWSEWAPDWQRDQSIHLGWFMLDALARLAFLTDDERAWQVADDLWNTVTRFHQLSPKDTVPLDQLRLSPISARMSMYPGTESKILSNIGRFGMAFPNLRRFKKP